MAGFNLVVFLVSDADINSIMLVVSAVIGAVALNNASDYWVNQLYRTVGISD